MSYSYCSKSAHENGLLPVGVEPDDYGGDFFGDLAYKQWLFRDVKDTNQDGVPDEEKTSVLTFKKEK